MLEPAVILGFVGVEVVEDDVDGRVGMSAMHEVEELDAPSALLVSGHHFAGGHLASGKPRRGPIALVFVAVTDQPVGTVRNLVCEAMMMRTDGASYGDRERFTGPTFGRS
jgi:hypothetical protein